MRTTWEQEGGGGQKFEIFANVIYEWPLCETFCFESFTKKEEAVTDKNALVTIPSSRPPRRAATFRPPKRIQRIEINSVMNSPWQEVALQDQIFPLQMCHLQK